MSSGAQGAIEPQKVELVLAQLDSLPPLAPVVTRILALTEDSRTNAKEIITLVETDPSLTARVLSLLGKADRGVRRDAVTVDNAVTLLGFETIRQVALATKVMEVFGPLAAKGEVDGLDRMEFWKHCLAVACAARAIAAAVQTAVRPEEAFVLGLLHDIGKEAVNVTMPKSYARVLRKCEATRAEITDVERAVLGVDHTMVGHRLAERWGLPQRLVECIWLHHHVAEVLPASVARGRHVQVVQLADTLVREHRIGFSGNYPISASSRELAKALGLPEERRIAAVESLAEEIESRAAWIGAEEITSTEVYLKALMRSTEELTAANASLAEQNRRLRRKAEYFTALGWLNQAVSPRASVREVCGVGAEALRRALSVSAVLVFVTSDDGRWVEVGLAGGNGRTEILERPAITADESSDMSVAVQCALAGMWIGPVSASFAWLVDRYREALGAGPVWLLPLVRERRWVGGAVFAADAESAGGLRAEPAEIEALSAALGLAIAQAQAQTAAISLTDELAEANRRWAGMQAELLRTRTLETVVAMAGGAAHELNNPLAVISGRTQMLRSGTQDPSTRQTLETIAKHAHACSDIVGELMDFAHPHPPRPETISLVELLDVVRAELTAEGLLDGPWLSIDVPSDTPPVVFDRGQLIGTFRELIRNAVEATEPTTRRLSVKAAPDLTEEGVVVIVADNGRGMTSEVLSRAMDPFFSHRLAGRGRGLGLARVQRWLQQNGGTIRLDSEPGGGTSVELRLPTATPPAV